jgi:hypothetical protein
MRRAPTASWVRRSGMRSYAYNADMDSWIVWTWLDDEPRELYARVYECSHDAILRIVNALNQMEIEG